MDDSTAEKQLPPLASKSKGDLLSLHAVQPLVGAKPISGSKSPENQTSVASIQADLKSRNKHFANEDYASKLLEQRNNQLNVHRVLILENIGDIGREKRWVRDLEEKERVGRSVAELEVLDSHYVLEMQKLFVVRQEKEKDLERWKSRREKGLHVLTELAELQSSLTTFLNGDHSNGK